MPNIPIKVMGDGGLIVDLSPWELFPNKVTKCENIRFIDGSLQSTRRLAAYGPEYEYIPVLTPRWLHAWERVENGDISVILAGNISLSISSNGGSWGDVTNPMYLGSGGYQGNDWNSFTWGRAVLFNNGVEVPQYLDTSDLTFVDLPNWNTHPSTLTTARSVRPFKSYMVAMDITDDGVRQETLVGWSDVSEPTLPPPSWDWQDPTTLAGRNPLPPDSGRLVDGLVLGDAFIIYSEYAAYAMTESGTDLVFDFRRVIPHGLLSKSAVCQYQNFHFVIGQDRIYTHDGFTVQYPADQKVESEFFRTISNNNKIVQCVHYQRNNEIVVLYETQSDGRQALIWNYLNSTWTKLSLGPIRCAAYGPFQPTPSVTYDVIDTTYDTETRQYNDFSTEAIGQFLYMGAEKYIGSDGHEYYSMVFVADRNETWVNPDPDYYPPYMGQEAYVERTGLDLDEITKDVESVKQVLRIAPQIDATGKREIEFRVGGQHITNGPLVWGPWVKLDPSKGYKCDVRLTYRYLAWALRCTSETWFRMDSMDLDIRAVSRR